MYLCWHLSSAMSDKYTTARIALPVPVQHRSTKCCGLSPHRLSFDIFVRHISRLFRRLLLQPSWITGTSCSLLMALPHCFSVRVAPRIRQPAGQSPRLQHSGVLSFSIGPNIIFHFFCGIGCQMTDWRFSCLRSRTGTPTP